MSSGFLEDADAELDVLQAILDILDCVVDG
jgi:hypothetical protein